jgi:hypothetical protein
MKLPGCRATDTLECTEKQGSVYLKQYFREVALAVFAGLPLLYVVTAEEDRFLGALELFCRRHQRRLWLYTASDGAWKVGLSDPRQFRLDCSVNKSNEPLRDPITLLERMKKMPPGACKGIFVLMDFQLAVHDLLVMRLLQDVARCFREQGSTIILLSPVADLPPMLAGEMEIFYPRLPMIEDLELVAGDRLSGTGNADLDKNMIEIIARAGLGLTAAQFDRSLAKALVKQRNVIDAALADFIAAEKVRLINQSGFLSVIERQESLDDLGGLGLLKEWLLKRQRAFTPAARKFGLPAPKGMLLFGVQGCGKSLAARVCASCLDIPLLRLDAGCLFSSQVGSSEKNVRQVIRQAEAMAPCVLWIDELEKALAGTGSSSQSDAGTAARVFATLAVWLQEKKRDVFVVGTANDISQLPPELLRKGRWDDVFFLDLPSCRERREIFSIQLKKYERQPEQFDLLQLAETTAEFSGAEIEQLVIEGLYDAFAENRSLWMDDLLKNIHRQVPLAVTMEDHVQALRSWAVGRVRYASAERLDEEKRRWRQLKSQGVTVEVEK